MRSGTALAIGCFSVIIGIVLSIVLAGLKSAGALTWSWAWVMSPLWGILVLELPFLGAMALYFRLWGMEDDPDEEDPRPAPRRD